MNHLYLKKKCKIIDFLMFISLDHIQLSNSVVYECLCNFENIYQVDSCIKILISFELRGNYLLFFVNFIIKMSSEKCTHGFQVFSFDLQWCLFTCPELIASIT